MKGIPRAIAVLLGLQVASGILVAPMFMLFPSYVEGRLGLPAEFSGNIRAYFMLTSALMAFLGGAVCDTVGRKPSYLAAMTGVVAVGVLFLVRDPTLMYGLALFSGLMFGLGSIAGQSYLMDTAGKGSLAFATAGYFMAGTVGNALGSGISGWVAKEFTNGYEILGWTMSLGHVVLMFVAWWLMPSLPRPDTPRTLAAVTGGYGEFFANPRIWLLLGLRSLPTVYWGAATLLMPLILFRITRSEAQVGTYGSVSLILSAICQVAVGKLVDRVSPRVPVVIAITLVTIASLGKGLFGDNVTALWVFGLLGAGAAWSVSVTMTTLVQAYSTEETKSRLLGITHVAWSAGFLGGNVMAGKLASNPDQQLLPFLVTGAGCAVAILCALGVVAGLPKTHHQAPPE